jgi:hypothetical protein
MAKQTVIEQHPRETHEKPPFDEPRQPPPGSEREMRTKPDHGEESYRGYDRLAGKASLITGGDSGIGKAVAIAYAREGADVLISYLSEKEEQDAAEAARYVEQAGRTAVRVRGDISQESHCRELV